MNRNPIIGVIGGGKDKVPVGSPSYDLAIEVGEEIYNAGAIQLCGGGTGVMEASAKGAMEVAAKRESAVGGKTIGIMTSSPGKKGIINTSKNRYTQDWVAGEIILMLRHLTR